MSAPTETADLIVLNPGQVAVSLELRNNSALEGCTKVDGNASGRVYIARRWPSISTGEELLWGVLAWLNGQAPYPDLVALEAGLDSGSYAAAMTAVRS